MFLLKNPLNKFYEKSDSQLDLFFSHEIWNLQLRLTSMRQISRPFTRPAVSKAACITELYVNLQ